MACHTEAFDFIQLLNIRIDVFKYFLGHFEDLFEVSVLTLAASVLK
jgi:hypothetical protein